MTNKNVVCVTPNPHRVINIVQFCAKFSAYEVSHMSDGIAISITLGAILPLSIST